MDGMTENIIGNVIASTVLILMGAVGSRLVVNPLNKLWSLLNLRRKKERINDLIRKLDWRYRASNNELNLREVMIAMSGIQNNLNSGLLSVAFAFLTAIFTLLSLNAASDGTYARWELLIMFGITVLSFSISIGALFMSMLGSNDLLEYMPTANTSNEEKSIKQMEKELRKLIRSYEHLPDEVEQKYLEFCQQYEGVFDPKQLDEKPVLSVK